MGELDATTLRLILLAIGIALVAGIYLHDRHRRHRAARPPERRAHSHRRAPEIGGETPAAHGEPIDPEPETLPELRLPDPDEDSPDLPPGEFVGEPRRRGRRAEPGEDEPGDAASADSGERVAQLALEWPESMIDPEPPELDPALLDEAPRLIVQIVLMAREGAVFDLERIRAAAEATGLRMGAMDIFHREDERGRCLFSMANAFEPGAFPQGEGDDFSTSGLVLFAQLPGVRDGLAIYSDMLFTAERLAALLDAELRDEARNPLTRQAIEHTRDTILEHRRRIELLRRQR